MKLLEYEAKALLRRCAVPVPRAEVLQPGQAPSIVPCVLKSQVPVGGRGKAGGIIVIQSPDKLVAAQNKLFSLEISGHIPQTLLAEELLKIKHEFYLALRIDRATSTIQVVAHPSGGVEVESNNAAGFLIQSLNPTSLPDVSQQVADHLALPLALVKPLLQNLLTCFTNNDTTLLEINPLVLTESNELVAADCKMTLDDAAAFRHPDWQFEDTPQNTNFVVLNKNGTVATIANGAGLAMATVDAVANAHLTPANFLDIGGGATAASVLETFKKIAAFPHVQAIIINIFAGITRCDEVAKAIIEARQEKITYLPPLFIRLSGTNIDEAATLLQKEGIQLQPSLASCIAAAQKVVHE